MRPGNRIHVQKARKPGSGRPMWLVLGNDYLPITPLDEFLTFHDDTRSPPNTIRAYAHHLKLYWEYLTEAGVDWRAATLQDIVNFVAWLRWGAPIGPTSGAIGERRKSSTINAILAAVTALPRLSRACRNDGRPNRIPTADGTRSALQAFSA